MKIQKGQAGYLQARKKRLIIETTILFALVAAILILGYVQTRTKLNYFTIIAVLGCLPASRSLVNLIMMVPHKTINEATELEISSKTENLTVIYDLVITSEKQAMPIQAIVISDNTVCGFTKSPKVSKAYAAEHIKNILEQNGIEKVTVKIFRDYVGFLSRAEGMNNIASIQQQNEERAEKIKSLILDISL